MESLNIQFVTKQIPLATSLEELVKLRNQLHEWFHLHLSVLPFGVIHNTMNHFHDLLIQRAVQLAEQELHRRTGITPKDYAFIVFGSAGRQEQTLWSDQDNGLIIDESAEQEPAFYQQFATCIFSHLRTLGYAPCDGNVICSDEKWNGIESYWSSLLDHWLQEAQWEHIRYLLMFADARCMYGDSHLLTKLHKQVHSFVQQKPEILTFMLRNTLYRKVSKGILGQLITEVYGQDTGGVDIKYGVYIPMVNGIRLLAIQHEVAVTSSIERIHHLHLKQIITSQQAMAWLEAFLHIIQFRAKASFTYEEGVYLSRGIIPAHLLTKPLKKQIKQGIQIGEEIQKYSKQSILV